MRSRLFLSLAAAALLIGSAAQAGPLVSVTWSQERWNRPRWRRDGFVEISITG